MTKPQIDMRPRRIGKKITWLGWLFIGLVLWPLQALGAASDLIGEWRRPDTDILLIFEEDFRFLLADEVVSAGWRCAWSATDTTITTDCLPGIFFALDLETEHIIEEGQEFGYAVVGQTLTIADADGNEVTFRRDSETAVQGASWGRVKSRFETGTAKRYEGTHYDRY